VELREGGIAIATTAVVMTSMNSLDVTAFAVAAHDQANDSLKMTTVKGHQSIRSGGHHD
jgi:Spy/CpxP family protein refolding chaperone